MPYASTYSNGLRGLRLCYNIPTGQCAGCAGDDWKMSERVADNAERLPVLQLTGDRRSGKIESGADKLLLGGKR